MIVVAGHVGNNEAVGAALAGRGYPVSVIADDSSYPELFELLSRQRESWGVKVIPWRNLRGLFAVLKRKEILALLVDWGYRDDGIPVKLFGAWTTLPAGPAALAAKSGAIIAPLAIRRLPDGRYAIEAHGEFTVPSSSAGRPPAGDPADRRRPRGDDRGRARAVVQLQADVARRPGRGARARGAGDRERMGSPSPTPTAGASSDPVSEVASP